MHQLLKQNLFFIKEQVGIFKASNNFDIYDPNKNELIMNCREDNLGFFTKMLRFTDYKRMTPFEVEIKTTSGEKILTVKRGVSIFLSTVQVLDENNNLIGKFKQKFFSLGGKFDILDTNDNIVCTLQGKWTSWNFKFIRGESVLAEVSKKWAGIGKELFTTADNYMLSIDESVKKDDNVRLLILAAVMCIDMVLKE